MKQLKLYNSDKQAILDDADYPRFEPNGDPNGEGFEPYWHYDEFGIRHPGWGLTATGEVGQIADVNCGVGGPYLKHVIVGEITGRIGPARVVNGNELDLRRENIRPIAGNKAIAAYLKTKPLRISGLYGVSWEQQSRKWVAKILHDGKKEPIGSFDTKQEAAQAYNERAVELYGRDAMLNGLEDERGAAVDATFDGIDLDSWEAPTLQSIERHQGTKRERLSRLYGVVYNQRTYRWDAKLRLNGSKRLVGSYATKEVAAEAYDYVATKVYGKYAKLNFATAGDLPVCDYCI